MNIPDSWIGRVDNTLFYRTLALLVVMQILDILSTILFVNRLGIEYEANHITVWLYNYFNGNGGLYAKLLFMDIPLIMGFSYLLKQYRITFFIFSFVQIIFGFQVLYRNWFYGVLGW